MAAAAIAGLIAGAVAGILLAPKSGKETREDLGKLADKMKDEIADRLSKLSRISSTAYKEVVDIVVDQYQDAKKISADQAKDLKQQLGASYDKVRQTVDKMKAEKAAENK